MPSRRLIVAALLAVAAATLVGVASGATQTTSATRSCAGADCVPDLVSVVVRSRRSRLVLGKSGGRGGSIADLSPDGKRVLIEPGLRLVTATLTGHVIAPVAAGLGTAG